MTHKPAREKYQLEFEQDAEYLLVRVTGPNSPETVMQYLQEVSEECQRQQCFKLLIDEQLEGPRLSFSEVFSIASKGAMNAIGVFQAIAYVDKRMGEMGDFAETVAVNRGIPIRSFTSVFDAEQWLLRQTDAEAEKAIFEDHNTRNRFR